MPQVVPAALAALAAAAAEAGIGAITIAGITISASTVGAIVGGVVAIGAGLAMNAIMGSGQQKSLASKAADTKQLIRSSIQPRRVIYGQAKVSGPIIYAASSGPDMRYLHLVIPLAGHPVQSIDTIWIGEDAIGTDMVDSNGSVISGKYKDRIIISRNLGNQTAADPTLLNLLSEVGLETPLTGSIWDQFEQLSRADGTPAEKAVWGSTDILKGVAYIYVRLTFDKDVFTGGIPNIAALVTGKNDIYDPRSGGRSYSTNWALCVRDYLTSEFGLDCDADEIDETSFIAAANLSDEDVPLNAGGTLSQPRYRLNGTFTLDEKPIDIMENMLAAGAGALTYVQGKYCLYGGAYIAPSATLTESDFAGAIELQTMPPRAQLFNGVKGTFIDPARFWQASEFPAYQDAAAIAADGEEIWRDVEFSYVTDGYQAQRLARQITKRQRSPLTFKAPLRYASLSLTVWQTVAVTLPDFGWIGKPFRIVSWAFNPSEGTCTATFQEEQVAAYAWLYDDALAVPEVPDTWLISPYVVPAPAGLTTNEALHITRDGAGVRLLLRLDWLPAQSAFVTDYEVQYRPQQVGEWRSVPPTYGERYAIIYDLAPGTYEVRVRGRTQLKAGDWAERTVYVGTVLTLPPADIAGLTIQSIGGLAYLRWTQVADLDVRVGGYIEIRHTPDVSSPSWIGATSIGDAVPGDATFALLPLKPGTYFVKAVDSGGRYSVNATSVQTAQATALAWASVSSLTEHPGFSGAKANTVVASSTLRLSGGSLLDSVASFDAITDLDLMGGIASSGTYTFSGGMDLAAVKSVRLTSRLLATVTNTNDKISSRTALIDDWLSFDGVVGGEADAWVEVRTTQTDPAGSPVWTPWQRLDASEFSARGFQFRAQLVTDDPAFNIHVSELSVTAEQVA